MPKALVNPQHLVNPLHPHRAVDEDIFPDFADQGPEEAVIEKVPAPKKTKKEKTLLENEEAAEPKQKEDSSSEKLADA